MNKCLLIIAMALAGYVAQAQITSYDSASVPAQVKKGAHIIKRFEDISFEVTDIDRASEKIHQVFMVMNEEGKSALHFAESSTPYRVLGDVEIKLYDANGRQIQKYRKKDLSMSAMGGGLVDDGKVYYIAISAPSYPVTVEYEYDIRYKGTLFYPSYEITEAFEGVENSTFTAKVPKDFDLRYEEKNISLKPEVSEDDKYKSYKWLVKNMAPVRHERGAPNPFPYVLLAPNKFKVDDYEGDLRSWKNFGDWYANLCKGLDKLPPDRVTFFNDLVKNAPNQREKARILYEYLQKNFRYVSIQLGIGGWRPFSADFTDKKKYGDCKALSNIMKAMLEAVGIKSYLAVIYAGVNASATLDDAFPSAYANHVILCAPMEKDTLWLECTSTINDFGVLGSFTENRHALLITENGGVLVATPKSVSTENIFNAHTEITLQPDGSGNSVTTFSTIGEPKDAMKYYLDEKTDDQKEYIVHDLEFKQPDEFAFKQKEATGAFITTLEMTYEKIPEFNAGNKMFINPRLYKLWHGKLPEAAFRKQDYYFSIPFQKTDTTIFKLPAGASVEALPKSLDLSCAYATYSTKYWYNEAEKSVYSTASFVLKQHNIPAAHYAEIKKFFDDVLMDDTQRIVVKKE